MPTLDPVKILLVDDRPANLLALEAALACPEYELVKARSGTEALRFLLSESCALLLLDVNMPEMDGYETARLIRQSERLRDLPIVFVTGYGVDARHVLAGYESGGVDYLLKPVDPDLLRVKVASFVALHRARQQLLRQAEQLREHERRAHAHAVAELELRSLRRQEAAQRRYRALVDGISHAIVWVAEPVSLACTFASPSALPLSGFEAERWVAEPGFWLARLAEEDRARFRQVVADLAPGGHGVTLEHRLVRADGRIAWFETALRLLQNEETGAPELRALSVDVTEEVRGRESLAFLARVSAELARSLDRRGTALAAARGAVSFLADGCVLDLYPLGALGAETVTAHADPALEADAAALAQDPALLRVREDAAFEVLDPLLLRPETLAGQEQAARLGFGAALKLPLVARGRTLGVLTLASRERGRFGAAEVTVAGELARRAAQAIDNALLYDEARLAVQLREEFMSIASHELRTPLSALLLQARLIERLVARGRGAEEPDGRLDIQQRMGKAIRQIERLASLVNALLDLARIRGGRIELALEPCDLGELARDVRARLAELGGGGGAGRVEVIAEAGLNGRWDRGRVDQLLTNLVANALKYGGDGAIRVVAQRAGDVAILSVSDEGPGIPPDEQARIFDRFERGGRRDGEGLGLGLYICRKIAEAHLGSIAVSSAPGQGTTFEVRLPLEPGAIADGAVSAAQAIQ